MRLALVCGAILLVSLLHAERAGAQEPQASPGALSKAHAALAARPDGCQQCHVSPGKIDAGRCLKCHQPIAARMAAKKGVHREVTGDCESCHQEHQGADADLRPLDSASFDHRAETGFPLTGGHASLAEKCATCHTTRSYLNNKPECSSCHTEPHQGALGTRCSTCHTPASGWKNASRAFHKVGLFPLQGKHVAVPCASCHRNGAIKGTPTQCYDCHWVRRQDDRYRTRLGNQCENCHTPSSWTMVRWNHASATGAALNAQHATIACDSCHKDQAFRAVQVVCATCHQADYQKTASPNHAAAGFPTACDACHKPSDSTFAGARFNHNATFPLTGAHVTQPCASCHSNNVYKGTPRNCVACHQPDYQRAVTPNHVAAGFPTDCEACHKNSAPSFRGATFNHSSAFALVGVHATQACAACHRNNVYKGTPRECYGCHQANYQQAQNPNHVSAGFPTTCDSCHRPTDPSFRGAGFNHSAVFQLVGVHATQACAACHKNNVYRGTPRDCVGCHLANYQQTRNPNHTAAGFPTTCEACHQPSDASFTQGRFTHTAFPITSGRHSGQACSVCHIDPNSYKVFSCTVCHDRTKTDSKHQGRAGYRYDSIACYSCHPQGRS